MTINTIHLFLFNCLFLNTGLTFAIFILSGKNLLTKEEFITRVNDLESNSLKVRTPKLCNILRQIRINSLIRTLKFVAANAVMMQYAVMISMPNTSANIENFSAIAILPSTSKDKT